MGQEKGRDSTCLDGKEEGRNYRGWEKETLAAYESPLGGTQKSKRKEINSAPWGFSQAWAASFRVSSSDLLGDVIVADTLQTYSW